MAHDILFNDNIARSTDHQQVFNIVTPNQYQTTLVIDDGRIRDRKPWLATSTAAQLAAGGDLAPYPEQQNQCHCQPDEENYQHQCLIVLSEYRIQKCHFHTPRPEGRCQNSISCSAKSLAVLNLQESAISVD